MHVFPTNTAVNEYMPKASCTDPKSFEYYISNCGFDAAGETLSHLLKNLPTNKIASLKPQDQDWQNKGVLRQFEQS